MSGRVSLSFPWRALAIALVVCGCASSGRVDSGHPTAQLGFGVQMAQRGLWNEALFRFEQARRLRPQDSKVLNDLAVAYEAVGRFDDALATYKEALRVAPGDRQIKKNYSRFVDFYQAYKPEGGAVHPAKHEKKGKTPLDSGDGSTGGEA